MNGKTTTELARLPSTRAISRVCGTLVSEARTSFTTSRLSLFRNNSRIGLTSSSFDAVSEEAKEEEEEGDVTRVGCQRI